MVAVALVAANVALARAIAQSSELGWEIPAGLAPMAVVVQAMVLSLVGGATWGPFRSGFVVAALAMMASFALPPVIAGLGRGPGGPGPVLAVLNLAWMGWAVYGMLAVPLVDPLLMAGQAATGSGPGGGLLFWLARAVVWSIPQFAVAGVAGLLSAHAAEAWEESRMLQAPEIPLAER
jgi:hypothetical protein